MERPLLPIRDINMDPQRVFRSYELATKVLSNKATSVNITNISLPLKAPTQRADFSNSAGAYPLWSLLDLSDCSTLGSRVCSTYHNGLYSEASSQSSHDHNGSHLGGVDVCDMISERLQGIFDLIRTDYSLVLQIRT
jgi:hypothetical protein